MLEGRYLDLFRDLSRVIPGERLIRDDLRTLAYGTDASFYRLVPKLVVRVDSEAEVGEVLRQCHARRLPLTFRAGGTSLSGQSLSDSVLMQLGTGWRGIRIEEEGRAHHPAAGRGRRPCQCPPGSLPAQDRTRPRLHQRRHGGGNRRQQRQRHVLRHLPEQLPDPSGHANHPCRRHRPGHPQRRQPGSIPPDPSGPGGTHRAPGGADAGEWGAGRSDSPQVQDEEHHRLQPERPDRLRRSPRRYPAPDDRLRRHLGLHHRNHLPHRTRLSPQGHRPDPFPRHPDRL